MSHYLVTGGTGFLGQELLKRIVKDHKVTVVSRNEGKLIELKQKYPSIHILAGDIANPFVARQACYDVNGVFHLAGFKHVGMAEHQSFECYLTNVAGTFNILSAADREGVDFIIGTSTDKACRVSGVYGATKLIMEALFRQFEAINPGIKYRIVRYGNVLYSTGSVLCKWKEKILKNEELILTDPNATRFYWTVQEAVQLLFDCIDKAHDSTPYVPEMKSVELGVLLEAMLKKYNPEHTAGWKEIGLQPGENKHEQIAHWLPPSNEAERFTVEEIMALI
jgi:UDP-N-acetylglucosamine 4,6-dehydratase